MTPVDRGIPHSRPQRPILVLSATTLLLLSGCLGVRPAAPSNASVDPPTAWRTALGPTATIDTNWWHAFGDPTLASLVERSLANNTDIGSAVARVRESRAQFKFSRAQQMPLATFEASTGESRMLVLTQGVDGYGESPAVAISYDLDIFGRLASATGAARAALLASAEARVSVTLAVAATTASGYVALLGLDARLNTTRATLASRAEALRVARRRADAGYTSRLELSQAESEYQATEQLIPAVELAVATQENALSVLVGDVPRTMKRGASLETLVEPGIPEGLPSVLLQRRPDLEAAREDIVANDRSLDAARAAELPDFSLSGAAGAAISTALPSPIALFSIAANVAGPIFDAGRLRARADAAAAQRDEAAFAYRRAALNAFREVEDGLASVQHLREEQVYVDNQVATLRETLRLATNRYREGYAPYLDEVDAERSLLAAQLVSIQIGTDRANSVINLYQAMGGGWRSQSSEQASLTGHAKELR